MVAKNCCSTILSIAAAMTIGMLSVSGTTRAAEFAGAHQYYRAEVGFSASNYSASQKSGFVVFNVERGAAPGTKTPAVTVKYATVNGTAIAGSDYTAETGQLIWAADDVSPKTISVPVSNAKPFAGDKTFTVSLSDPSDWCAVKHPDTATATITGDAVATVGGLELADAAYSVAQNAGSMTVTVTRVGGSNGAVGVSYATANGTAIAGQDYTAASGSLKWADGDATAKSFSVAISNKTPFTNTKTFAVALAAPTGSIALDKPTSAIVTIKGDASESAGSVSLSTAAYSVAENAGSVTLSVDRTGGASDAASVSYATANGTATAGTNYTATTGTLEWAAGDAAAKTISVPVSNGTPFSGSKTFSVTLSQASGASLGSPGSATVTVNGDATTTTMADLELSSTTYSVAQTAGSVAVSVKRSGSSSAAVSVAYATTNGTAVAGTNYTAASGTLQWEAGDMTAKSFTVPVSTTPFSGTKAFNVALSSASSGAAVSTPSNATVTVSGSSTTTTTASSGATWWVYHDGVFAWGGDYSTAGSPNYSSTAGAPESGTEDIAFSVTGRYGIWAPYAGGTVPLWDFNSTGYNYITMDLKPTVANQSWQFYFMLVGDKQIIGSNGKQIILNLANYGPAPVVGQWGTYKIPLVDVLTQYSSGSPVYESAIYKFGLQDETGLSSNVWYIDNVGFTVN